MGVENKGCKGSSIAIDIANFLTKWKRERENPTAHYQYIYVLCSGGQMLLQVYALIEREQLSSVTAYIASPHNIRRR